MITLVYTPIQETIKSTSLGLVRYGISVWRLFLFRTRWILDILKCLEELIMTPSWPRRIFTAPGDKSRCPTVLSSVSIASVQKLRDLHSGGREYCTVHIISINLIKPPNNHVPNHYELRSVLWTENVHSAGSVRMNKIALNSLLELPATSSLINPQSQ